MADHSYNLRSRGTPPPDGIPQPQIPPAPAPPPMPAPAQIVVANYAVTDQPDLSEVPTDFDNPPNTITHGHTPPPNYPTTEEFVHELTGQLREAHQQLRRLEAREFEAPRQRLRSPSEISYESASGQPRPRPLPTLPTPDASGAAAIRGMIAQRTPINEALSERTDPTNIWGEPIAISVPTKQSTPTTQRPTPNPATTFSRTLPLQPPILCPTPFYVRKPDTGTTTPKSPEVPHRSTPHTPINPHGPRGDTGTGLPHRNPPTTHVSSNPSTSGSIPTGGYTPRPPT
ncbi:hypothetical protein BD410DRAFT_842844 [Rickenella mellea]|uniref:Uncharacterized protein n=1 Tax=Rickenella mellea TaxID=50990 RepID=A0A4Y7PU23_9AGAM|nr:hypothetical protein BD410DRAFT_842844 [Rickenella mellea]